MRSVCKESSYQMSPRLHWGHPSSCLPFHVQQMMEEAVTWEMSTKTAVTLSPSMVSLWPVDLKLVSFSVGCLREVGCLSQGSQVFFFSFLLCNLEVVFRLQRDFIRNLEIQIVMKR